MKKLNIYITEKLKINKDSKLNNEELVDLIVDLTNWKELKFNKRFLGFLEKNNINNISDFKYIYKSAGWPKDKLSKSANKYIKENIPSFVDYSNEIKQEINDKFSPCEEEVYLANGDLSNTLEVYFLNDKLQGFDFCLEISKYERWYLTFVLK